MSAEPTQTLPINICFCRDTKCSHINVAGFATASDAMRMTAAAKVRKVLQTLRIDGEMTFALLSPGICALPDSLLHHATDFEDTTALVVDMADCPTVAIVSNNCAPIITHERGPDGKADPRTEIFLHACTTIWQEGEEGGPWVSEMGVVYRHNGKELDPDYIKQYKLKAGAFAPSGHIPTGASRDSRQRDLDQVLAHYSSGAWGKGHTAWTKYVAETFPCNPPAFPWASLNDYLKTGQERRLWSLLTFYTDPEDEMGKLRYRDFHNPHSQYRVAADESLLGVGW